MKGCILVLDDDEDTLEVLSILLQEEGYQVSTRNHLIEDLAEVERLAPVVVIVDLFMSAPHAGWEFLQHLKAHPATTPIPIILCTAGTLTPEQLHELLQLVGSLITLSSSDVE
jgi:CheY-like chemotaxis protein